MSGTITLYRGYRIRQRGDQFQVDYRRRTSNPHLPRAFTWTDLGSPADLQGYIDALIAQNAHAQRPYENHGAVQALNWDAPIIIPTTAPPGRVRMGLAWMEDILAGRESCTVQRHAWIEVRTDKDRCQLDQLLAWRTRHGVVPSTRHRLEAPHHAAHAQGHLLAMMPNWWVFHGWGIHWDGQRLQCTRLVPRYPGEVQRCCWSGPSDGGAYTTLRNLLTALNAGSHLAARTAERAGHITAVEPYDHGAADGWIQVSPVRLAALLSGDDVLRIPPEQLVRTRRWRGQRHAVAWHATMVDTALDPWHAGAVSGAQQLGMRDLAIEDARLRQLDQRQLEQDLLHGLLGRQHRG